MNSTRYLHMVSFARLVALTAGFAAMCMLSGCMAQQKTDAKLNAMQALCETMFTYPGDAAESLLWASEQSVDVPVFGAEVPAPESESSAEAGEEEQSFEEALQTVYGDYFTEQGYTQFSNSRLPLSIFVLAEKTGSELHLDSLKLESAETETDNTWKYTATVVVNGEAVEQLLLAAYEGDRLSYFDLGNDAVENALNKAD